MQLFTQWKGVSRYLLSDAASFYEHYDQSHGIGYPLAYLALSYLVVALPLLLVQLVFEGLEPASLASGLFAVVFMAAFFMIYTLVESLVAHAVLALFGASGYSTTLEAYAFPAVIRYALWWLPLINLIPAFVGLYLQVRGLGRFHDVPEAAAATVAIVAAVIPYLLFLAVLLLFALVVGGVAELLPALPDVPV